MDERIEWRLGQEAQGLQHGGPTGAEAWAYQWSFEPLIFADGFESGDASAW